MFFFYALSTPTGRAGLILGSLLLVSPALFSYYTLRRSARLYNVCFVGPAGGGAPSSYSSSSSFPGAYPPPASPFAYATPSSPPDEGVGSKSSSNLSDLYGTYRTFDGASYYYVKTPFEIRSSYCVTDPHWRCGWPSATSLSDALSPRGVRTAKESWRKHALTVLETNRAGSGGGGPTTNSDEDDVEGTGEGGGATAAISWDRGHPNALAEGSNRWCLSSSKLREPGADGSQTEAFPNHHLESTTKICTREVPSIMSDGRTEPYFAELPLSPPPDGIWIGSPYDDDDGAAVTRRYDPTTGMPLFQSEPPKVRVHCHTNDRTISTSAGGNVEFGPMDEKKGKMTTERIVWNPLRLPGTMLLVALLVGVFLHGKRKKIEPASVAVMYEAVARLNPPSELWRIVRGPLTHGNVGHLALNVWCLYWIGATVEEDVGTVPFLSWNFALMALNAASTLAIAHLLRNSKKRNRRSKEEDEDEDSIAVAATEEVGGPTLSGYSSIVVAWIVLLSLERNALRPFPYVDVSIPTFELIPETRIVANAAPLAYLVLCKFLADESSTFVSHVVGAVWGLFFHWNFPPHAVLAPQVWVSAVVVASHLLPVVARRRREGTLFAEGGKGQYELVQRSPADDAAGVPKATTLADATRRKAAASSTTPRERRISSALRCATVVLATTSVVAFDHGTAFAQCVSSGLFCLAVRAWKTNSNGSSDENQDDRRQDDEYDDVRLFRSYFLVTVVVVISDAMAGGSWAVARVFVDADPSVRFDLNVVSLFLVAKIVVNVVGMAFAASVVTKGDANTDLVGVAFDAARVVGDALLSRRPCGGGGGGGGEGGPMTVGDGSVEEEENADADVARVYDRLDRVYRSSDSGFGGDAI